MAAPLLEIDDLRVGIRSNAAAEILRGVSLTIERGETLAVVGESGCGKSLTSLSVMGLLPDGLEKRGGTIRFEGAVLPITDNEAMRRIRGRRIGMVFQEPMAALNPVFTIGDQVAEVILEHEAVSRADAWSTCWRGSACRTPRRSRASTRTASPAGSASAWSSRWRSPAARTC